MSRVNYGAKPIMLPQPVLIIATYDENGVPNAMNAAWGITTDFSEITISLGKHKTTDNLMVKKAFTVSMGTEDTVIPCYYVGIESAAKVPEKFFRAGFHATKSAFVDAPLIDELPMALECKVKSFSDGILVGEIVNVSADESVVTDGKNRSQKAEADRVRSVQLCLCRARRKGGQRVQGRRKAEINRSLTGYPYAV